MTSERAVETCAGCMKPLTDPHQHGGVRYLPRPTGNPPPPPPPPPAQRAPQENGRDELRREIEALPNYRISWSMSEGYLVNRAAVLAIVDRLAAAAPPPERPAIDVERLAEAIADHDDICSRMAIPECADKIAATYAALRTPKPEGEPDHE